MLKKIAFFCGAALLTAAPATAQTQPATLATLFEDVFGPRGLVVSSDDVQLDGTNHAAHFNSAFQSDFRLMNIAIASQLTAVPVPSPASGFIYQFDSATGTFTRATRSFGPILTDRAETIGRGRIAFGFNLQHFSFDRLDGVSLSAIPAIFRHDDFQTTAGRSDVISTVNSVKASVTQYSTAVTYGLASRLDMSLVVPIIRTQLSLLSNATVERVGTGPNQQVHYFFDPAASGNHGTTNQFSSAASAAGVGDVLLRLKANVANGEKLALAMGVDGRLPSGDEENLLGSGAYGARPFIAMSAQYGAIAPHLNLGYQWNGESVLAGDVRNGEKADLPDRFTYAVGTDVSVNSRLSIVFDIIGARVFDSPRLSTFQSDISGPFGSVSLGDLRFDTASYWSTSGAFGMKANVAPQLLLNLNLRFALDNSGLTDRLAPLVGLEWAF
jgi:hypothetical protein